MGIVCEENLYERYGEESDVGELVNGESLRVLSAHEEHLRVDVIVNVANWLLVYSGEGSS